MKKYIKKLIGLIIVSVTVLSPYIMIGFQEGFIKACLIFLAVFLFLLLLLLGLWMILS